MVKNGFIILLFICVSANISAQLRKDPVIPEKSILNPDTLNMRHEILEEYYEINGHSIKAEASRGRKILNSLIGLVYETEKKKKTKSTDETDIPENVRGLEISSISIRRLDIFGASVYDTTKTAPAWLGNLGRSLHVKTKEEAIRNDLLFEEGDIVYLDIIRETERLIRSRENINDVRIIVRRNPVDYSFADVLILVQDVFSLGVNLEKDDEIYNAELYEKNLFGEGTQLSGLYSFTTAGGYRHGAGIAVLTQNLYGSFVNTDFRFIESPFERTYRFKIDRSFITDELRFGGGITIERSPRTKKLSSDDPIKWERKLNFARQDIWVGSALKKSIPGIEDDYRIYGSLGYLNYKFFNSIDEQNGNRLFYDRFALLGALTFIKRRYVESSLIYGFGKTEDLPVGNMYKLILGYQFYTDHELPYLGAYFGKAGFLRKEGGSYYTAHIETGAFKNGDRLQRGEVILDGMYISKLFKFNQTGMRTFLSANYALGFRRFDNELLYLNEPVGIRGFKSRQVAGTRRLLLKLENVFFTSREIRGFGAAVFSFVDFGVIGGETLVEEKVFYGLGAGLRLRNDKLVFKTIQIRFAFYPVLPPGFDPRIINVSTRSSNRINGFIDVKPKFIQFR